MHRSYGEGTLLFKFSHSNHQIVSQIPMYRFHVSTNNHIFITHTLPLSHLSCRSCKFILKHCKCLPLTQSFAITEEVIINISFKTEREKTKDPHASSPKQCHQMLSHRKRDINRRSHSHKVISDYILQFLPTKKREIINCTLKCYTQNQRKRAI